MARHVTVLVVDSSGRPKKGARVGVYVHRFMASGFKNENFYTNSDGKAEIELSDDSRITLYVDGAEMRPKERQPEALIKVIV